MRFVLSPVLTVSCPPHAHCGRTVKGHYLQMLVALLPAAVCAAVTFGYPALRVMALACSVAVVTELVCARMMERPTAVDDLSGLTAGLLFAFLLPASAPWWLVAMGSAITVALGKMIFGGLGASPICAPALGWAVCRLSWPLHLSPDASMLAFPLDDLLTNLKLLGPGSVAKASPLDLLLGNQLGGLGDIQVWALLAGGIYLVATRWIHWAIPAAMLGGVLASALVLKAAYPAESASPLFHLLAGGTVFGAFFLATDGSSSPSRLIPMVIFGLTAGVLLMLIRFYGVYSDGVPFAILLANLIAPLCDKIRPKPFGVS
ncbi:MAG: RnfABCDGE type electron transport complex subunit D [Thermodesulfobacteriota bacterium]